MAVKQPLSKTYVRLHDQGASSVENACIAGLHEETTVGPLAIRQTDCRTNWTYFTLSAADVGGQTHHSHWGWFLMGNNCITDISFQFLL